MPIKLEMFQSRHGTGADEPFFRYEDTKDFSGSPRQRFFLVELARRRWAELADRFGESVTRTAIHLCITGLTLGLDVILETKPPWAVIQLFHFDREVGDYVPGGAFF